MSAYVSFFMRGKDDTFYPIYRFSRNTELFFVVSDLIPEVYTYITSLTDTLADNILSYLISQRTTNENMIQEYKDKIQQISQLTNNSVYEKMEVINNYESIIEDTQDDLDSINYYINFIEFLSQMKFEAKCSTKNDINSEEYIYVGIEAGYPTVENIYNKE